MKQPPSKHKKATISASTNSTSSYSPAQEDNPGTTTIDVAAVEVPEMTEAEQSDRLHLERQVEKAFYLAGKVLTELRDRRLYRSTHKTFEEYCRDRFGFERRYPYRLIESTVVVDNLIKMCPNSPQNDPNADTSTSDSSDGQILPINEYQLRPLIPLEPEVQREAWLKAVQQAGVKFHQVAL